MGKKRRGRDRSVTCASCGGSVPRSNAISYDQATRYSTELDNEDDVTYMDFRTLYYCKKCAMKRKIIEKKKKRAEARRKRGP